MITTQPISLTHRVMLDRQTEMKRKRSKIFALSKEAPTSLSNQRRRETRISLQRQTRSRLTCSKKYDRTRMLPSMIKKRVVAMRTLMRKLVLKHLSLSRTDVAPSRNLIRRLTWASRGRSATTIASTQASPSMIAQRSRKRQRK